MTRLITLRRLIAPKPLILNQSPLGGSRKALLAPRHTLSHRNYASNSSKAKPLMLEKPARYQSPSHPAAPIVRSPPRQYPGPALSPEDEKRRKTKRYPNTMPAKGTFMYWFLTTRSIHVWITLSTLSSLAGYTFINDFLHTTPYTDLLPEAKSFFAHPIVFLGRYLEVYKMHTAYISAQTAERRRKRIIDVEKRAAYRKAHGIHKDVPFGGWWPKSDGEVMGPGITLTVGSPPEDDGVSDEEYLEQAERERLKRRRRPVKRWFGIWE